MKFLSFFLKRCPLILFLTTTACGSHMNPDIKQNPHPKMRYEITMTVDDAPGPFDAVTGFIQYEVQNKECVPESDPISGVRIPPSKNVAFVFNQVEGNVFTTTVYTDLMQDEDYFGLGLCRWAMTGVVGELRVRDVTFSPDLGPEDFSSQKSYTRYFVKHFYHHTDNPNFMDSGIVYAMYIDVPDRSKFFPITMVAKESFL